MKTISMTHVSYSPGNGFDEFVARFEKQLGRHDASAYAGLPDDREGKKQAQAIIEAQEGTSGFMLFAVHDHGRRARQYVIGNPLYEARMTAHDIRAALYAPLRLLVYLDAANRLQVEYDQPSTVFGQFRNPAVDAVARELDVRLANIVQEASSKAVPQLK